MYFLVLGASNVHLTKSLVEFTSLQVYLALQPTTNPTGSSPSLHLHLNPCFKIKVPSHFTCYRYNRYAFQADSQF